MGLPINVKVSRILYEPSQETRDKLLQLAEAYQVQSRDLFGFVLAALGIVAAAGDMAVISEPGVGPFEVIPFFDGHCVVKHKTPPNMPPATDVYYMPEIKEQSLAESIAVASALNTLYSKRHGASV